MTASLQSWAMVTPSAPAPGAATDLGYGVGAFLGRHLYHYAQAANSNGPIPGAGQLWRWAPAASSGAAAPASSGANMAIINGHTAGIAITVLLCTAILALSVLSAQQLGALPWGLGDCCGSGSVKVPSGFYVTSNSPNRAAAAAVNGGYVAPPDSI